MLRDRRTAAVVFGTLCALLVSACPADPKPADPEIDAGEEPEHDDPKPSKPQRSDAGMSQVSDAGMSQPPAADGGDEPSTPAPMNAGSGGGSAPSKPDNPAPDKPAPIPPSDKPPADNNAARRTFLPTNERANTRNPKLLLDRANNLHAVYPAYAGGDAYYTVCPNNCSDPSLMQAVRIPTQGTVLNAMIALTRAGAPRVLLSTGLQVLWAECDQGCNADKNWHSSVILDHGGDREVTGNALALDANDHPRFVMHTYVALLGIGQRTPQTFYAQCDSGCAQASSWRMDPMFDSIFQMSQLRFDSAGRAHLATVAVTLSSGGPTARKGAYLVCERDCNEQASWDGIVLMPAFDDYTREIAPAISLALTAAGAPRVALLGKDESGVKTLAYFECDKDCQEDNWRFAPISNRDEIGSGVDLQLDARNHPRLALTFAHNIGIYHCEADDCTGMDAKWELAKVEFATDIPKDELILWPNCTIASWALHDPSLVLGAAGTSAFVGYQATDVSGGSTTVDPKKPACLAGKDMTLSRLAILPAWKM